MTPTCQDPHAALRARLATTPLPEPGPERIRRWQAALDELVTEEAAWPDTPGKRRRKANPPRHRHWLPTISGLAAAAAAVTVIGYLGLAPEMNGSGQADSRPLVLSRAQLLSSPPTGQDFGPFTDPATREFCLSRFGPGTSAPLAGRQVVLDGRPGVLLVLPTERPGRLRLLVVSPDCQAALTDDTVGG